MKKLSHAQVKLLRDLAQPDNRACFTQGIDAWWLSSTYRGINTRTLEVLEKYQFINIEIDYNGYPIKAYISPKGWNYLKSLEAPNESI